MNVRVRHVFNGRHCEESGADVLKNVKGASSTTGLPAIAGQSVQPWQQESVVFEMLARVYAFVMLRRQHDNCGVSTGRLLEPTTKESSKE